MQSLRVLFGIFRESYKIITSRNVNVYQIQIIFLFTLPTFFIFFINKSITNQLFPETGLNQTSTSTVTFNQTEQLQYAGGQTLPSYLFHSTLDQYSHFFSSEALPYWLLQLVWVYPTTLVGRLLHTSAGTYTAACNHTGQEVSFHKVMSVISKVWKRLIFTFFFTSIAHIASVAVAIPAFGLLLIWIASLFTFFSTFIVLPVTFSLMLAYLAGIMYLEFVYQLAHVVSVLEEAGGFKAMKKSNQLLKGNIWVASIMFLCLTFVYYVLQYAFGKLVMYAWSVGMVAGVVSEMISSVLMTMVFVLIEIVTQTVLYCVCKSHHHENVGNLALLDQLDQVNVSGGYAPFKTA